MVVARWSRFYLALVVALVYGAIGVFYLVPNIYHPFSGDSVHQTQPHAVYAGIFIALAILALVAGGFSRPPART